MGQTLIRCIIMCTILLLVLLAVQHKQFVFIPCIMHTDALFTLFFAFTNLSCFSLKMYWNRICACKHEYLVQLYVMGPSYLEALEEVSSFKLELRLSKVL